MVRSFPRTTRRRALAAVLACVTLATLAAAPLAAADDLNHRKHQVQKHIHHAHRQLDQSSTALVRAAHALDRAQARLSTAQDHLASTRAELKAAAALDRQMRARLAAAVQRLSDARTDLSRGRTQVGDQQRFLGRIAAQNYQSGSPGLVGLSMLLRSKDPDDLTSRLNSMQNVLDKQQASLDRLQATKALLIAQERRVHQAKDEVAVQRRRAAEQLARKKALESKAQQAAAHVRDLVHARAKAKHAAARAKRADLSRLHHLQKERHRITAMLKKRAARERARARRRAAARAARAARPSRSGSRSSSSGGFLSYPVHGPITSPFGMRMHPIYHRYTLHDGTDFGVACGTPVHAAASGRVVSMYYNEGYGNRIIVDDGFHHGVSLGTSYNHLSRYLTHVGAYVHRGQVVAYSGTTGFSTGCHLHFMVFENGRPVNPMGWL